MWLEKSLVIQKMTYKSINDDTAKIPENEHTEKKVKVTTLNIEVSVSV